MSASTLDKATDKIIDQMMPEELAKYINGESIRLAGLVNDGEITIEEVDKLLDLLSKKHLIFHDPNKHIRYLKALINEMRKHMMLDLGQEHLRHIDSAIESSELVITALNLANLWLDDVLMHSTADGVLEEKIKTALNNIEKSIKLHFKKIDCLEDERMKFLNHERWRELGVHPEIKKRESLLPPEIVELYTLPVINEDKISEQPMNFVYGYVT